MHRVHKKGCQNTKLERLLNKLFGKHFETFKRLADTAKSFVQLFRLFKLNCGFLLVRYLLIFVIVVFNICISFMILMLFF